MTRALAIIAAARAGFIREPSDKRTDMFCMAGIIIIIQVGMVLAGGLERGI